MKAPLLRMKLREVKANRGLPQDSGTFSRNLDSALPGPQVRLLYDSLRRPEAAILAQLRTGRSRLNTYLHKIQAAESDQCQCGKSSETVKHFLFQCKQWAEHREEMKKQTTTRWGDLSFYLGGKSNQKIGDQPIDPHPWKPSLSAVRATIRFANATGRFAPTPPNQSSMQQLGNASDTH